MSPLEVARWVAHACAYGIVAASVVRAVEIALGRRRRGR
jgi:hypothetical protein